MKKNSKKTPRGRFSFIFTVTVTVIIALTNVVAITAGRILFLSPAFGTKNMPRHSDIIMFLLACMVIGIVLSVIFSRIIISPLDEIINALNRVIDGDYSAKVRPRGIRRSRRLGKRFNSLTDELTNITMLNENFVNNFSHEFKTPITSVHGFAKLIKNGNLSPEKQEEYLDIIIRESQKLAGLATDTLLFTKINNTDLPGKLGTFNVTEQIRETVVALQYRWGEKDITFDLSGEDCDVTADRDMLSHVWLNIADNAIKFTGNGGEISINVSYEDGIITVTVKDNGAGMKPEVLENVFNKFYQGDTSHATPGNGLGLPLAKKITDIHGGEIFIESEEGRGTIVTVRLPSVPPVDG